MYLFQSFPGGAKNSQLIPNLSGRLIRQEGILRRAIGYFLFSFVLCLFLSCINIYHRLELQRLSMEQLITEKGHKITEVISKLLYKTEALAALVIQNDGLISNFEHAASVIMDDPAIRNLLLAPKGFVGHVYPLRGNERLLGYDLLSEGAGNKEAAVALERGALVFGGPFKPIQGGGQVLVGRLPLWLDLSGKGKTFWGLVSVTLNYPEALTGAGLEGLAREGFAYEIWRISPDDGKRQIIASSLSSDHPDLPYIELPLSLFNSQWYFRIMPVRPWHHFPENWVPLLGSLLISLLIGCIVHNNETLKSVMGYLERMVITDVLTQVHNRAGLFHIVESLIGQNRPFRLYYCDLDHFKHVNDTHGHNTGDKVLVEFCRRIKKHTTPGHTLARIGGDEFVLLYAPPPEKNETDTREDAFWNNVDIEFAGPLVKAGGKPVPVTFSKGAADFPAEATHIDALIALAEQRMYQGKRDKYAQQQRRRASDF